MNLLKLLVSIIIFVILALSLWNGFVKEGFEDGAEGTEGADATDSISYTDSADTNANPSSDKAPDKALDKAPGKALDKAPGKALDKASDKALDKAPGKALDKAPIESTPDDEETMDIAIENTTKLTELFDKVNNQMDIVRTLKTPYSNKIVEVKFVSEEGISPDTIIQTNILNLLRNGVKPNDDDLRTNAGIKKYQTYGGMAPIIDKLIQSVSQQCTAVTDINKCYRMSNQKNIDRIESIVNTHQSILDKIMEKQ